MIISGYQGIGKSSLAKKSPKFIDLESSNFFINEVRPEDWHIMYSNVAISLSHQGYHVFISSHKCVRDYLAQVADRKDLVLVYPDKSMKSQWIKKLYRRFLDTNKPKDYRALKNAEDKYDESIDELSRSTEFSHIILCTPDYSLEESLKYVEMGLCVDGKLYVKG